MPESQYLNLDTIEVSIAAAATQIYASYIAAGRVPEGFETQWMIRSVEEAIQIANFADERVLSKDEFG